MEQAVTVPLEAPVGKRQIADNEMSTKKKVPVVKSRFGFDGVASGTRSGTIHPIIKKPKGRQGRHDYTVLQHQEKHLQNYGDVKKELAKLNGKFKKHQRDSLTTDEKFRRNSLIRVLASATRRENKKAEEDIMLALIDALIRISHAHSAVNDRKFYIKRAFHRYKEMPADLLAIYNNYFGDKL
jgi:hypothetical protein